MLAVVCMVCFLAPIVCVFAEADASSYGCCVCAAAGVTMIATIHSPTAYSFSLLDSLMMLVRGRCVHVGLCCRRIPCSSTK
jgi:sorbitol-specific phosphotransferase system component IIC